MSVRSFIAGSGWIRPRRLAPAPAVEPEPEAADQERRGEEVHEQQPVLQGVDSLAEREPDRAALGAHRRLLLLEVLDGAGRLGRGEQPAAVVALLSLELGELGLDLLDPG